MSNHGFGAGKPGTGKLTPDGVGTERRVGTGKLTSGGLVSGERPKQDTNGTGDLSDAMLKHLGKTPATSIDDLDIQIPGS